ncbi:unnamed protein product, partial [Cladocopium goreaui]
LPNISASVPQLLSAIKELQAKGFSVPDFPADPQSEQETEIRGRYAKVLGSAVNPVLREGNSDRRVARPVKEYAMKHPHRNHEWTAESKSCVASMEEGDFFASEQSCIMEEVSSVRIELVSTGKTTVLKAKTPLLSGTGTFDGTEPGRAARRGVLGVLRSTRRGLGVLEHHFREAAAPGHGQSWESRTGRSSWRPSRAMTPKVLTGVLSAV